MFGVCLRYAANRHDAEDILQEGFVKVFRDLHQYSGVGNLEGWVRKVFVNTALQYIQKQRRAPLFVDVSDIDLPDIPDQPVIDESMAKQLLNILQQLPTGFRTVFNLYVLEGYTHPEIAEILDISVGTSKSQLMRAKAHFRNLLETQMTL